MGFPGGSVVKNLPAELKTWILSRGRPPGGVTEEKEMTTLSSILPREIPRTEEAGRSWCHKESYGLNN